MRPAQMQEPQHKNWILNTMGIAKVRINRAKELIREGVMNFSEISDMLDFDNPQYFSRVFKRETGMTPSEFKHSLNFRR